MELRAALSYQRTHQELYYWCSTHQHEVDFIIGDEGAVEVKANQRITTRDSKGLRALKEEGICQRFYLVSRDPVERLENGSHAGRRRIFLNRLGAGALQSASGLSLSPRSPHRRS